MTAPCPMCAASSSTTVTPGNMWMVQFSCTLHPSSTTMPPQSPRMAAPGPTYTSRPIVTFPVTVAFGWMNALSWITGMNPSNAKTLDISRDSRALEHGRHALPHADAHGSERIALARALQLPRGGEQQACAAHPERMPERDRAAVRVDAKVVVRK